MPIFFFVITDIVTFTLRKTYYEEAFLNDDFLKITDVISLSQNLISIAVTGDRGKYMPMG